MNYALTTEKYERTFNICRTDLEIDAPNTNRSGLEKAIKKTLDDLTCVSIPIKHVGDETTNYENFAVYFSRFCNPIKASVYLPAKAGMSDYIFINTNEVIVKVLNEKGISAKIVKTKELRDIPDKESIVNWETGETRHLFYTESKRDWLGKKWNALYIAELSAVASLLPLIMLIGSTLI